MLAKFSGKGSNTITRTVKAADISRGASTSAASRGRRNAIIRITAIANTANMAAERNAPMIVALVASIVRAVPRVPVLPQLSARSCRPGYNHSSALGTNIGLCHARRLWLQMGE
jgi:hypothetical protein